jgi:hypothetical protein
VRFLDGEHRQVLIAGGTKISSTRYIQYGTIDFVLRESKGDGVLCTLLMPETSKWPGVITAAITMSDVKVSMFAFGEYLS